ncbi:restriction endonuclease subunit S [Christiangramia flava]|uniref:Type I restriction-modification system, specificity subunit S n=2 Tax=Christiangramia TaxID=292691 RepID=A0A1L7I8B8_9FLAO|nr:restriction endonuclease subunit S [Christiangramia flava]APU69830.1 Type I restriction-modification system, specificity subunit S [Christiangramia flava JLT2011]
MRFPEYEDDWQEKKVIDIAPLQRGFDLPTKKVEKGKYPVVYSNGILRHHKKSKVKAPGIVTGRSGTIGKVTYVERDYWPHNTSLWVTDFKNNYPKFIYFFYLNLHLERYNAGSTVPTLNRNDVHSLKKRIPKFIEQQKISSFLTAIEKRIETQNKIIKDLTVLKNSLSKKLYKQKMKFPEFKNDWKFFKLGEMGKFFSGGTPLTSKKNYYEGNIPFIKSGEINAEKTEQFISNEGLKNSSAKMVEPGDLIFALYGATSGEVGISKFKGAINQAILCIKTNIDNGFLLYYLRTNKNRILKTYLQGGQGNLSAQIIKSLKVPVPSKEEQQKTASLLSSLDRKIELENKILEQYILQKKYFLQHLFI